MDSRGTGSRTPLAGILASLAIATTLAGCALTPAVPDGSVEKLAAAIERQPVVLLGEMHDNAIQHAIRLQALTRLLEGGSRPAFAFEQFDRDRQEALDAARAGGGDVAERARRMTEAAGGRGWNWAYYRPYIELALRFDLPVVAANLSRAQAMRVGQEGVEAVFDGAQRGALGLDTVDPQLLQAQVHEVERGHCGRMPADALEPMARAQIARDAVLAASIAPYAGRGVVLITGNGHARRDIGVVRHLPAAIAGRSVTVGLLEVDDSAVTAAAFDVALFTPAQERPDPCASLPRPPPARIAPAPAR